MEQKSLALIAIKRAEEFELLHSFHTFSHNAYFRLWAWAMIARTPVSRAMKATALTAISSASLVRQA